MRSQFTLALTLAASQVNAFWGTSHLLIAAQAQNFLEAENPAVLDAALAELYVLKESHPDLITREVNHPFVECATFADDIKSYYSFQAGWHFIDQPYTINGDSLDNYPDFEMDEYDIVGAMTNLTQWLQGSGDDYLSTYYWQQVTKNFPDQRDGRSFALRMVIHYAGDIHQPLHTSTGLDSYNKKGDRGGNSEYLPSICGAGNLHAVWDSEAYNYCGYPVLPLSDSDWLWYETESESISAQNPTDASKLYDGDFMQWAQEGYELTATYVYPDYHYNTPLTDEYIANMDAITRQRMMYGARRLADLMVQIYGNNSTEFLQ